MYGKTYDGVLRKTFIIDENQTIEKIIEKVKTKDHTNQIFQELKILIKQINILPWIKKKRKTRKFNKEKLKALQLNLIKLIKIMVKALL